jgi:hypothetical protein
LILFTALVRLAARYRHCMVCSSKLHSISINSADSDHSRTFLSVEYVLSVCSYHLTYCYMYMFLDHGV